MKKNNVKVKPFSALETEDVGQKSQKIFSIRNIVCKKKYL
uniref:Uncharacterized protein n=1 Tax=viral metagenome TaxID=1070528 RepID=A0A6C0B983_9ZZZZ